MDSFTKEDLIEMLSNGDDGHRNQIRVSEDGIIYLSQDVVGAERLNGVLFRFETFEAGNDYVGSKVAANNEYTDRLYRTIMKRWEQGKNGSSYIDIWEE
ncbi:MAG: hypothetical protein LUD00_12050 [Prevotellaceae bacterium]|nr:hypothetical protein [Prevotellaceae bacterium]